VFGPSLLLGAGGTLKGRRAEVHGCVVWVAFGTRIFLEGAMGNRQGKPFWGVPRTVLRWVCKAKARTIEVAVEEAGSVVF
jgi:hypothetical protein